VTRLNHLLFRETCSIERYTRYKDDSARTRGSGGAPDCFFSLCYHFFALVHRPQFSRYRDETLQADIYQSTLKSFIKLLRRASGGCYRQILSPRYHRRAREGATSQIWTEVTREAQNRQATHHLIETVSSQTPHSSELCALCLSFYVPQPSCTY
jgi:hypothetical protein